jgi:phage-related minor tail protein
MLYAKAICHQVAQSNRTLIHARPASAGFLFLDSLMRVFFIGRHMGIDIATIGIALDSRPVTEGTAALDKLVDTSTRVEKSMQGMNGQMNDTAAIMRKNAEASSSASEAAQRFLAPLQREIDLFGLSRAETEKYNAAKAGLTATTQRQAAALGAAIDAMQRDEQAARAFAASQDQATRAADQFLKKLNDQVAVLGMNAQQLQTYRAAQLGVSDAAAPLIARLGEAGAGAHGAGKGMEALNFQTVGARRELLVLAHELSQGNYQKFGGSMMVLGEQTGAAGLLFSAAGLSALALVGTLGLLAYATIKGALDQKHMNDALVMTGNYAGQTSDSLNDLAHAAVSAGGSIGEAKKVAIELAGSGKFTGEQIGYITEATVAWEHATGQSVKSIIKDFESLAVQTTGNNMRATEAISRATIKLDDQYHFLTESIYEQIRALEKEGDAKGASALATETFAKATHDRAEEIIHNLGYIARAWNSVKEAIGGAGDAAGDWGKKATPASEVARLTAALKAPDMLPGVYNAETRNAAVAQATRELTQAQNDLNAANATATAQGKATLTQSEGVHAASRIAADDVKLQKRGMTELAVALKQYADDVAKVKAANPTSALVTDGAVTAHVAAITKAHTTNVKGNDDRAKTLQDALVLEQTGLDREKSIYDARDKMLTLYHSKFGMSDADFYAGRENARAEYVASEAIAFAKESALVQGYRPKNAEEVAANKAKYDELVKQHLKFVDDMRNAGGDDRSNTDAAAKKLYDDQSKAIAAAGDSEIKSLDAAIAKQREHNAEIGKSKEQIELAKQAQMDAGTAALQIEDDAYRAALNNVELQNILIGNDRLLYEQRLAYLDRIIAKRKEDAELLASGAVLEANSKAATDAAKAWKRTADTIEQSLTDSLMRGFESGKGFGKNLVDTIRNMFNTLVLRPIISAIVNPVAGAVTGAFGASGTANAATSGLGSAASSLLGGASLFGAGGLAGSMMAGAGWLTGATTLGGSLAAAGSLAATGTLGGIASSLGMVVGALGPIALGIGAAVAIWKSLDNGNTEHTGGAATASSAGVSAMDSSSIGFHLPQRSTQADTLTATLASGIVSILDSTALAFGKTAGYTAATAFADDSSSDGAWGALLITKLGEKVVNWQDTQTSRWAPKEFADGAAGQAQYLAALSTSVRTALDSIGLPDWAKSMLDGLGAGAGVDEIAKVVDSINVTQRALVIMGNSLVGFAQLGDKATSALIAASGGIEALAGNASAYYDAFYSTSEKSAGTIKQIQDALASVNIAMPATQAAFRAQVEAQMALGEAGAPAVSMLLKVAGAFAQVNPQLEATATAARSAADILSERTDLQKQYDELTMTSIQLEKKKRDEIALENRALYDQLQAAQKLKDAQDAAKTSLGDVISRMKTFGDSAKALHDGLLTGGLSTLTPEQQYAETRRQYESTLALAKGGDTAAQGQYSAMATAFLTASQKVNSGDSQYGADFAGILQTSDDMAKWALGQVDVAQASLDALNAQVIGISDLNATMLSVADAVNGLPTAFAAAPTVVMPAPVLNYSTMGTANTEALVAEVKALRVSNEAMAADLKGLRADQQKQTGDSIGAVAQVQQDAAQTIVSGVGGAIARAVSAAQKVALE